MIKKLIYGFILAVVVTFFVTFGVSYGASTDKTINDSTEETAPVSGDFVWIWDVSIAKNRKVTLENLGEAGVSTYVPTLDTPSLHSSESGVTIKTGYELSGDSIYAGTLNFGDATGTGTSVYLGTLNFGDATGTGTSIYFTTLNYGTITGGGFTLGTGTGTSVYFGTLNAPAFTADSGGLSVFQVGANEPLRLQNLLTNSGFGVWSNSEGIFVVKDSAVSGYFSASGTSVTVLTGGFNVGDHIVIGHTTDGTTGMSDTDSGVSMMEITAITADGGSEYLTVEGDLYVTAAVSAVTDIVRGRPGVATNDETADGWKAVGATVNPSTFREGISGTTKAGSYHALKFVTAATSVASIYTSLGNDAADATVQLPQVTQKVAGRTMTVCGWASSTSSSTVIFISDSERGYATSQHDASTAHSGGGNYEWLEATFTFGDDPPYATFGFYAIASQTVYLSQPILVYGSSCGQGNYTAPVGEVVWFESHNALDGFSGTVTSTNPSPAINIEVVSNGAIPKNVEALFISIGADADAAARLFSLIRESGVERSVVMRSYAAANQVVSSWVDADSNGNIRTSITGSWTNVTVRPLAVQLR